MTETQALPTEFGKYRLLRALATGGMAELFLAEKRSESGAPVVIKRILPHLNKREDFVSMFLDEARIASRLQHPNIVRMIDVGQVSGSYYIAMEFIDGRDLRQIYNQAYTMQYALPLPQSIYLISEAAKGLGFAHAWKDELTGKSLGLVHRDVSPQNILVSYKGDVKIADFGIAKATNKVAQTRAGVLKGKYSYMSPEQAVGSKVDHRTDIFALGVVLYEMTTGVRLFKRQTELETLQAIIKCDVQHPAEVIEQYPLPLADIMLRALAKQPDARYQDASQLAHDLEHFLQDSGMPVQQHDIQALMEDLFHEHLQAILRDPSHFEEPNKGSSAPDGISKVSVATRAEDQGTRTEEATRTGSQAHWDADTHSKARKRKQPPGFGAVPLAMQSIDILPTTPAQPVFTEHPKVQKAADELVANRATTIKKIGKIRQYGLWAYHRAIEALRSFTSGKS